MPNIKCIADVKNKGENFQGAKNEEGTQLRGNYTLTPLKPKDAHLKMDTCSGVGVKAACSM